MNLKSAYLHVIDGRIRIKIQKVKGSHRVAKELERRLMGVHGMHWVRANPTTGNVLIHYDNRQLRPHDVIDALRESGFLTEENGELVASTERHRPAKGPAARVSEVLLGTVAEIAFKRLITAIV